MKSNEDRPLRGFCACVVFLQRTEKAFLSFTPANSISTITYNRVVT
jgi:hypothetical protein